MFHDTPGHEDWQRTANAMGLGLGVASIGFSVSQLSRRPEVALAGIIAGTLLTAALWHRTKDRR